MTTTRTLTTLAVLGLAALLGGPAAAQGLKAPGGPLEGTNCNPSTNLKPWTCKCDSTDSCNKLAAKCEHVDGKYYQCDKDHTSAKSAGVNRLFKSN